MKNAKTFQYVLIENRKDLPDIAGVYFVMQDEFVLYIGISKNIRHRWAGHHKLLELSILDCVEIHWIPPDGRPLLDQEIEWINYFKSPMNRECPVKRKVKINTDWRRVPDGDRAAIATMTTRQISERYQVSERTAQNWKHYATEEMTK